VEGDKGRRRGKDDSQRGIRQGRHSCEDEKSRTGGMQPGGEESGSRTLALFAAMEINALMVLSRDLGKPDPDLFLAGSRLL